jgi:hypothetical protein
MIFLFCNPISFVLLLVAFFGGGFCGIAAAAVCVAGGRADAHLEEGQETSRE